MIYKIKDKNGIDYEIEDIKKFSRHIFEFHSIGTSLHQENGHDFIIDNKFRKKMANFIKEENTNIHIKEIEYKRE